MTRQTEDPWIQPAWKYEPELRRWLWKDEPFESLIENTSELGGCLRMTLPARYGDSLNWEGLLPKLTDIEAKEQKILWQLDLGILPMRAALTEEGHFRALKLGVEQFVQKVWRTYREISLGVVLHQSNLELTGFYWDLEQIEQLAGWLCDCQDKERYNLSTEVQFYLQRADVEGFCHWSRSLDAVRQYKLQMLSQYWHYLASCLDEDCPALVVLENNSGDHLNQQIQLLSQPIWEHIYLIASNVHDALAPLKMNNGTIKVCKTRAPTLGLVVPDTPYLGGQSSSLLANLMQGLDAMNVDYRLILESQLTQQWSGLDELIVIASTVSPSGLRMLRGFQAAMGQVHTLGDAPWVQSLRLPNEQRPWNTLLYKLSKGS